MTYNNSITSIKDNKVLEARSLQSSKGRIASKKFLVEGEEQILWVLDSPCKLDHVFAHDKQQAHPLISKLKEQKIPVYFVTDGILKKISDTSFLVPFIGVAKFPLPFNDFQKDLVVVLDGVNDFGNVGTIIRTASAFGIKEFASTKDDLDFYYKKTIDASRGTAFSTHLQRYKSGKEALDNLREQGYQIAVTTPHASVMQAFAKLEQKPIAIVFGNETNGVSPEVMQAADIKIQIPMSGSVESLNVGVAAGITLYEMKIKLVLAMLTRKIQESIGGHLYSASRWIRLVFDAKLKEVSPFSADQAIIMMILKCDGISSIDQIFHDSGISPKGDIYSIVKPLIDAGYVNSVSEQLTLTEKGEEATAKIWVIHELAEKIVFEGVTEKDKINFVNIIEQIYKNCEKIVPFN